MKLTSTMLLLMFIFLLDSLSASIGEHESNQFIIGGSTAAPGEFPYVVYVMVYNSNENEYNCVGSIIGSKWILTVGHCAYFYGGDPLYRLTGYVVAGTNSLTQGGTIYNISQGYIYPTFDPLTTAKPFDIGLLQLTENIKFDNNTKPIVLARIAPPAGSTVISAGWGYTSNNNTAQPDLLKKINLTTIDLHRCGELSIIDKTENPICALPPKSEGLCTKDSGAPLVFEHKLVGVHTSGGSPCASGPPDVFTNAVFFHHWIYNITGLNHYRTPNTQSSLQSRIHRHQTAGNKHHKKIGHSAHIKGYF